MIVNHKAGELVSGLMSRQYRIPLNVGGTAGALVAGGVLAITGAGALDWLVPAGVGVVLYGGNFIGRLFRIRSNSMKPASKTTEDEILELQDIYFRIPKEHKPQIEKLLVAAYQQIERGNPDGVQPRLQQARDYQQSLRNYVLKMDDMEDVKSVKAAARAMHLALEAGTSADGGPVTRISDSRRVS